MSALPGLDPLPAVAEIGHIVLRCILAGLGAMIVVASIDFAFQRYQHTQDLRMSKKEIRDELKNTDGDPHVKGRIRQIQRELASRRMMSEVPNATVVITNPTHYAVALTYNRQGSNAAPRVVAKGVDHVALKIREIATEADVPIYEDPPLARALHAQTEIGDVIPEDLFQAVAGVLAYVYRLPSVAQAS